METMEKRSLSSPFIYGDLSSFKINMINDKNNNHIGDINFNSPGEIIKINYISDNGFYSYTLNNNNYILLSENDNYFYNFLRENNSIILNKIKFNDNKKIFLIDKNLINTEEDHTNLSNMITNLNLVEDQQINLNYNIPSLNEIFKNNELLYSEKSNESNVYLYATIIPDKRDNFIVNNYIYELRINGIPTNLFDVKKIDLQVNSSITSIHNLQIKINSFLFRKKNKCDELNTFSLIIKNKFTDEIKSFYYSRYADFIKPYVSYDSMVNTTDDITINCRYDVSLLTTNQTKDTVVNIDNPSLIMNVNGKMRPVIDNNIVFEMNDRNINLRALTSTIVHIKFNSSFGTNDSYIISSKDINFKNKDYKIESSNGYKIKNTEAFLLSSDNDKNQIDFRVESISDIKNKKKYNFSIHFFKISDGKENDAINNNLKFDNHKTIITVNFTVTINPDPKFEFTQSEEEILNNILSFQTDTITANFGESSLFSIKANDNIKLNESELNNEELKKYIANGGRDLNYIESHFPNFDLNFYGIYVDHMIMEDGNIGSIYINRINDVTDDTDSTFIEEQRLVCNALENNVDNLYGDNCKDGFNEYAFMQDINGYSKHILIVPEDAYNLFNFLNSNGYSGCYSMNNTEKDIFEYNDEEYLDEFDSNANKTPELKQKLNNSSFALYPYADFSFIVSENNELNFNSTNLYIDYYPVVHRLTKKTDGNIVWTIYNGDRIKNLQNEKIIRLVASAKTEKDEPESEITDETNSINDTNSTVTYPSFVTFKIVMETEAGDATKIDNANYIGKITNVSELPILIKDISIDNFIKDSILFKTNESNNSLDDKSFMKYNITGGSNYIYTESLNIAKYVDHSDIDRINGDLFIIKPGGFININIYNNTDLNSVPDEFGKTLNKIKDSLHYELYYIQENNDTDNDLIKYTYRETGNTNATNIETLITVYPLISNVNFDTEYYRYGETVYNIITNEIIDRTAVFRLIKNKNDISKFSEASNYEKFTEDILNENSDNPIIDPNERYIYYDNITFLELENIYFLESGKNFSYRNIMDAIKEKYTLGYSGNKKEQTMNEISKAIGIQVIARTKYTTGDTEYNMALITNYIDLITNADNYTPRLNRLTGSIYHLLKIENKHEELYDYKIMVDDKEYKEGDIIYNQYANETALHKFRLFYKPNFEIDTNYEKIHGVGGDINYNGDNRFIGNFTLYFDDEGKERDFKDFNFNNIDDDKKFFPLAKDSKEYDSNNIKISPLEKIYLLAFPCEINNYNDTDDNKCYYSLQNMLDFYGTFGFSDLECLRLYVKRLNYLNSLKNENEPLIKPSELALKLGDFDGDGEITEKDIEILENVIKEFGYLVGDLDLSGDIQAYDSLITLRFIVSGFKMNKNDIEKYLNSYDGYTDNVRVFSSFTTDITTILDNEEKYKLDINSITSYDSLVELQYIVSEPKEFYEKNKNAFVGKYILELPLKNTGKTSGWTLADSFEGCIDGTKPIVPNLLIPENSTILDKPVTSNKNILNKYSTLTRDEFKNIICNPDNILNENTYFKDTSILQNISNIMRHITYGESGISALKFPEVIKDNNDNITFAVLASNTVEGKFQITNTCVEKINVEINQRRINEESLYPFTIRSDAVLKNITYVNEYQPIFTVEPNTTLTIYIKFNDDIIDNYETLLDIRVQNNIRKKYIDNNIKWDNYIIKLINRQNYNINYEIIKKLLPYKFYDMNKNNLVSIAEYYDMNQESLFHVLDINNFNRTSLYTTYIFLDGILIYDSNSIAALNKEKDTYKLLISEKILDRKLFIGDHTLTVITNKYNGLINYQNYYITLIDHNIYKNDIVYNYFNDNNEKFNKENRKSIIPRHPRNENYNSKEYENELFLDTSGDVSMVTRDYSDSKEKYYLYRFTEILQHYMSLSSFIVDSDQYLFEKNYQEVLNYYNLTKNEYNSYLSNIFLKLNRDTGEIYNIIDRINYRFENFDNILNSISEKYKNDEKNKEISNNDKNKYEPNDNFISRLFYNDNVLYKYKNFNILYGEDIYNKDQNTKYNVNLKILNDNFEYDNFKNDNYILINDNDGIINVNNIIAIPFDPLMNNDSTNTDIIKLDNSIFEKTNISDYTFRTDIAIKRIKEINNSDKNPIKNYRIFVEFYISRDVTYILTFNLYNIESSLKLDNYDDIKFSYKDIITRNLINNTGMYISFQTKMNNTVLISGEKYFMDSEDNYSSSIVINYESKRGYYMEDKKTITLPPYSSCKIHIKGNCENNIIANPRQLVAPSENDEIPYNLLSDITNNEKNENNHAPINDFIFGKLTFNIVDINTDDENRLYNYTHINSENKDIILDNLNYSKNLFYSPYPTVFMSKIYNNDNFENIIQKCRLNENSKLLLLFNDTDNNICGNFFSNGYKNIEVNDNKEVFSYFPYRNNKVISADITYSTRFNTYNDFYSLNSFSNSLSNLENSLFPIIVEEINGLPNNKISSYSFSVHKGDSEFKVFKSLKLSKNDELSKNGMMYYNKINGLISPSIIDENNSIMEGSINDNLNNDNKTNNYNDKLNNSTEYILANLTDRQFGDNSNYVFYIYPYIDNNTQDIIDYKVSGKNDLTSYTNKFNKIYEYKNTSFKEDELFNYNILRNKLFKAYDKPKEENNTNDYAYVINSVNSTSSNLFDEFMDKLNNVIKKIYDVKSSIAVVQQNIVNQKSQLNSKASVKEFKEWINCNVFTLAEYEYVIQEAYADIYYLSNKGLQPFTVTKTILGSNKEDEIINVDLSKSYPLINIYRNYNGIAYYSGVSNDPLLNDRLAHPTNKLISVYDKEKVQPYNKNNESAFYIKKYWIDCINDKFFDKNNVSSALYKKNFIETSKLYNILGNEYSSANNSDSIAYTYKR